MSLDVYVNQLTYCLSRLHSERYSLASIPRDADGVLRFKLRCSERVPPLVALGGSVLRVVGAAFHPPVFIPLAFVSIVGLKRWL